MNEITFLKNIQNIAIWNDPSMGKEKILIARQELASLDPEFIFIPQNNEETFEVEKINRNRNFEDIRFVICNLIDPEDLDKMIKTIKKIYK
jgi:hypothetical protein